MNKNVLSIPDLFFFYTNFANLRINLKNTTLFLVLAILCSNKNLNDYNIVSVYAHVLYVEPQVHELYVFMK